MAYHTKDYGVTFKQIADETKVHGHVWSIVQDPEVDELWWLGTDYGLFLTMDGGQNWSQWMHGFPSVATADLKIHPREHDLIIGTFGRAAWILDDIRPIREIARTKGKVLEQTFKVFEAPDAYLASRKSYDGFHFPGDAHYMAENRSPSAMLTLWVKNAPKKKKEQEKADASEGHSGGRGGMRGRGGKEKEVKVIVYNMEGDSIRSFTNTVDTGMNRIYWNLQRDGVQFPSRRASSGGGGIPWRRWRSTCLARELTNWS